MNAKFAGSILIAAFLGGCGGGDSGSGGSGAGGKELSGTYVPQGNGMYKRFEFQPGHKVAVTTFLSQTRVLDYVSMPDGRIRLMGDKVQSMRDPGDGCLVLMGPGQDGVEVDLPDFGRYCRE